MGGLNRSITTKRMLDMKYIIALILLSTVAFVAMADDTFIRNGATCDIPKGFNVAPEGGTNILGMGDFCEFPFLPILKEALKDKECEAKALPYPICEEGLVVSPGTLFPCYRLITDG